MKKLLFALTFFVSANVNAANNLDSQSVRQQFKNAITSPYAWFRTATIAGCGYVVNQNAPVLRNSIPYSNIVVPATLVGICALNNLQQTPYSLKYIGSFLINTALPFTALALSSEHLGYNHPFRSNSSSLKAAGQCLFASFMVFISNPKVR